MIRILAHDKEGPQSLLLEDIIHFCRERQVRWEKKYSGTFQRTALKDKLLKLYPGGDLVRVKFL